MYEDLNRYLKAGVTNTDFLKMVMYGDNNEGMGTYNCRYCNTKSYYFLENPKPVYCCPLHRDAAKRRLG